MSIDGDYISREAAKKRAIAIPLGGKFVEVVPVGEIEALPADDVRPVVRGKWIWLGDCSNEGLYCSECRNKIHEVKTPKKKLSSFCSNCGADMRPEPPKEDRHE